MLALEKTKPSMARRIAKNVDVEAEREGEIDGREIKSEYDAKDNLQKAFISMKMGLFLDCRIYLPG